ncbi:MAG: ATP synthase F1 subunit epsilon [Oscillospiraceae bacterium]|nr:ATP synthase F1 subunit epsilon [Oscillospiraceae bacterium]
MATTFELQIVTPDGQFFSGQAEKVLVRTIAGDVCILAHHIDYVTALGMGTAKVTVDGKDRHAACIGGMLTVAGGAVCIAATTFEWAEDIDVERAKRARQRAEDKLKAKAPDSDRREIEMAEAKLKRALVRIGAANTL